MESGEYVLPKQNPRLICGICRFQYKYAPGEIPESPGAGQYSVKNEEFFFKFTFLRRLCALLCAKARKG